MADWLTRFVDDGTISMDQLQEAHATARSTGGSPEDALVQLGYIDSSTIAAEQAAQFGYEFVTLDGVEIPPTVIEQVPESKVREDTLIPLAIEGDRMKVAIADPSNYKAIEGLQFLLAKDIDVVVAPRDKIIEAINKHYAAKEGGVSESVDTMMAEFTDTQIDLTQVDIQQSKSIEEDENAPVIKLVNLIIGEAVKMRASDIHIEPFEDRIRIRYRIDGVLVERDSPPRRLLAPLVARIKIMGSIDIAEKRRPQDGRIKTTVGQKEFDLRVSIMPTNHGQAVVLRILDRDNIKIGIRNLGFSEENYRTFQKIIRRPNGIFLVTGPTGSGKTTTLYSALGELNRPDRKIITAEDPVEYYLPGINQVEVRHNIGLDFSRIIRAMLRQAPNVILVGEIRDKETANMAIQASLTGHLVFSTLHTNDAPGSITRLTDMGVQSFLVASSVMAVMAQRLVRRVCEKCAETYTPTPSDLTEFEISDEQLATAKFRRGKGCNACSHTGYRGRRAVFELMTMNGTLREMTFRNEPTQALRRQARLFGMKTLADDALEAALEGVTTLAEVHKLKAGGH